MSDPIVHQEVKTNPRSSFGRVILYTPVLVLFAAMGAVAMFPEQSGYYAAPMIAPLLGNGKSCPGYSNVSSGKYKEAACGCSHAKTELVSGVVKNTEILQLAADESAYFETGMTDLTSRVDPYFTE